MPIDSLHAHPAVIPSVQPPSSRSVTERTWSTDPTTEQDTPRSDSAIPPASNAFQNLASDIQAILIQTQNTAATPAAASPEQKLISDMQAVMNDLSGSVSPTARTVNADPSEASGRVGHHHHHHHHREDGGDASGSSAVANATSFGSTVSQFVTAGITRALQAYAGGSGSTATPSLIA